MVKKVSLYKMFLKNFTGTNANVKARKLKQSKINRIRKESEKREIARGAERLRKAGYTGEKLKKTYKKVKAVSREEKMRFAVSKHLMAKNG